MPVNVVPPQRHRSSYHLTASLSSTALNAPSLAVSLVAPPADPVRDSQKTRVSETAVLVTHRQAGEGR